MKDPNSTFTGFDTLLRYLFREMDAAEETAYEDFLSENPDFEEALEGARAFALEHRILNRQQFEMAWQQQSGPLKQDLSRKISQYAHTPGRNTPWLGISLGVLGGLLIGWMIGSRQSVQAPPVHSPKIDSLRETIARLEDESQRRYATYDSTISGLHQRLDSMSSISVPSENTPDWSPSAAELKHLTDLLWQRESDKLKGAGAAINPDAAWERVFSKDHDLQKTLEILDKLPDSSMKNKQRFLRGSLRLLTTPRTHEAISDLEKADFYDDVEFYLLLAYAQNGEMKKAKKLLPQIKEPERLPGSLLKLFK